jgi:hypothetical protein
MSLKDIERVEAGGLVIIMTDLKKKISRVIGGGRRNFILE